jgi:uncharacterized protein YcbX
LVHPIVSWLTAEHQRALFRSLVFTRKKGGSMKEYTEVACVRQISRYPVKSMAGESLDEVKVGWHGLAGDRRFAFVRGGDKSGLPWLSAREFQRLILYSSRFADSRDIASSSIIVTTPDGRQVALDSTELLNEIETGSGIEIRLIQIWRGTYDSMPISLISSASVQTLSRQIGLDLEVERFRANMVVDAFEDRPFPEDKWVGRLLVFGDRDDSVRIRVNRRDLRCSIVNLDPKSAKENPAILNEIVTGRKNLLGVYASTERPGTIKVGDVIRLLKE